MLRNYAFLGLVFITPVCSKPLKQWAIINLPNRAHAAAQLMIALQRRANKTHLRFNLRRTDVVQKFLTRNYTFTYHYVTIPIFRRIILFRHSLRATAIYIENQGMRLNCRFVSQCIMIEFFPDGRCGVCRLNGNMSLQTNHKFKIRLVAGFHFAIGAARKMQIRCIFPIRRR